MEHNNRFKQKLNNNTIIIYNNRIIVRVCSSHRIQYLKTPRLKSRFVKAHLHTGQDTDPLLKIILFSFIPMICVCACVCVNSYTHVSSYFLLIHFLRIFRKITLYKAIPIHTFTFVRIFSSGTSPRCIVIKGQTLIAIWASSIMLASVNN